MYIYIYTVYIYVKPWVSPIFFGPGRSDSGADELRELRQSGLGDNWDVLG